jgi:MGT family glycosyltransferase
MRVGADAQSSTSVAFFAMAEEGHFQRLRAVISGVVRHGATARVFTHRRFAFAVAEAGAEFVDMFAQYPLEVADNESIPIPSRFVTYAACYAESIAYELASRPPSLIIADTFSVVGRVVASILEVPFVNVCSGHNMAPAQALAELALDSRVNTSERCHHAVEVLRDRYGLADASPFSYVSGLSPWLNLYCEPSEFLTEDERKAFAPIAFFGSLPDRIKTTTRAAYFSDTTLKIYISFGTVVWRYYADEACDALAAIVEAVGMSPNAEGIISLGRIGTAPKTIPPNIIVLDYVDQDAILREADVFVSHLGLNSTHEAIFHAVPMISYPFFSDQPALAAKCAALGIAVPLVNSPRGVVNAKAMNQALGQVAVHRATMRARLLEVRKWEIATISSRDEVLEQILALSGTRTR